MGDQPRHPGINISSIPVAGIGGLGMIVIAVAIAATFPLVRWVVLSGAAGGLLVALAMILFRRRTRDRMSQ
jgi:hypothetical protein